MTENNLKVLQVAKLLKIRDRVVLRLIEHGFLQFFTIGNSRQKWVAYSEYEWFRAAYPILLPKLPPNKCTRKLEGNVGRLHPTLRPEYKPERLRLAQESAKARGGECLSPEYVGSDILLKWRCDKGHIWRAPFNKVVHQKSWCRVCFRASGKISGSGRMTTSRIP